MDKMIAGLRISRGIRKLENMLDEVLVEAGKLQADVSRARVTLDESALSTQRPIARLASLQQHIVDARSKIVGVHADLAKISANQRDIPTECSPNCQGSKRDTALSFAAAVYEEKEVACST
jgi:hypothetical protein